MLRTALLAAALLIPPPGTASRGRDFCDAWLAASLPEQYAQLEAAEERDGRPGTRPCRGARARSLRALDTECRNWRLLMDFEVRRIVDAARARCEAAPAEAP